MEFRIVQKAGKKNQVFIIDDSKKLSKINDLTKEEVAFAEKAFGGEQTLVSINKYQYFIYIYLLKSKKTNWHTSEVLRKAGAEPVCSVQQEQTGRDHYCQSY